MGFIEEKDMKKRSAGENIGDKPIKQGHNV
ncbi:Uncharacterised protein [Yersinia aldovae]|uniref:Uncharacterized protein n=1 Tax=Yersinia aldovae TaxID=29483 RepID=A0A0T9T1C4_YERAL|nr:Uncharacterised protein [Yersinia aldovae]CNK55770.1 Uncharacterised protein [Yersinia aldovae]CNK56854.1 Uncharacterised protein [Yersinia aldovae]